MFYTAGKKITALFADRAESGKLLACELDEYRGKEAVVYALPRGGVLTAFEIANYLKAPLELIITRKIGHPTNPEYAIASLTEHGELVESGIRMDRLDKTWLTNEIQKQRDEITRREALYLRGKKPISCKGKIALIVDDGIATGLTVLAAIKELKRSKPAKIIVATPVIPQSTVSEIQQAADILIALATPEVTDFFSIGTYYKHFAQVTDEEVIAVLAN